MGEALPKNSRDGRKEYNTREEGGGGGNLKEGEKKKGLDPLP